ncbi:unnamed protein product [Trypanosoma congolense IL3000]|uniref:WGS project CAEQ00000000 data, annotated contig 1022 n=1 Tax=Trypanosoma congolense (strain IL3000) TaxID=1068625 RepID=F9W395_TRYCI|nr:unnamed protein product [Trypanosoma congolense IL3000]
MEAEKGRYFVCARCGSAYKHNGTRLRGIRAHATRKMKDEFVVFTLTMHHTLQCWHGPMKCEREQCLTTMHLQAKHSQPKEGVEHNALKAMRQESAAYLLVCQTLFPLRQKHGLECLKEEQVYHSEPLARSLADLFKLKGFHDPTSYFPVEKPNQAVRRGRSPDLLEVPSPSAQFLVVRVVSHKDVKNAFTLQAVCFTILLEEARTGPALRSVFPAGLRNAENSRASSGARAR